MRTLRRILGVAIGLGLLLLAYRHFFPNDETRIRRLLMNLAATASIPANPTPVGTVLALDKLKGFFSPDVQVDVDIPFQGRHSFTDRDELVQAAAAAWSNLRNLKVEFLDIYVKLDSSGETASAVLTAKATQPGDRSSFLQEFRLQLRKQENGWLIARAETVRVLR